MSDQNMAGEKPNFTPEKIAQENPDVKSDLDTVREGHQAESPVAESTTPWEQKPRSIFDLDPDDYWETPKVSPSPSPMEASADNIHEPIQRQPHIPLIRELKQKITSARFHGYVTSYVSILKSRGVPDSVIDKVKIQRDIYDRIDDPDKRASLMTRLRTDLDLLIDNGYRQDMVTVSELMIDAGMHPAQMNAARDGWEKRFTNSKLDKKTRVLTELRRKKEDLLILNFGQYQSIWNELNPDGNNAAANKAKFDNASEDRGRQASIAEHMYEQISLTIRQRAFSHAAQFQQLSIDLGLPAEYAVEQASSMASSATKGSMRERLLGAELIRSEVEILLLKSFGISSSLYDKIVSGSGEEVKSLNDTFSDPNRDLEHRIRLARKYYRKIDGALDTLRELLFSNLSTHLIRKEGYTDSDVKFEIHRRKGELNLLPRAEQYRRLRENLAVLRVSEPIKSI